MSAKTRICYLSAVRSLATTAVVSTPFLVHGVVTAPSQCLHLAAVFALVGMAFASNAWARASSRLS